MWITVKIRPDNVYEKYSVNQYLKRDYHLYIDLNSVELELALRDGFGLESLLSLL